MTHPEECRQDDAPWRDPLWNLAHQRAVATAEGLYPEHMQQGRREAYWRALQREYNSLAGIDPPKAAKTYADGLREAAEIARGRWGHRAHVYSPVRHVVAEAIESRLAELEGER